jgi:capsular exopolysaccharide synthesis family protein
MSKFFDQSVRFREVATPFEEVSQREPQERPEVVPAVQPAAVVIETSPLDECRKLEIPLSSLLQSKFQGSDSLEPVQESYRALRTRLLRMRSAQGLRSIVIASAVQGEGKTMTSLNLAMCCAQLHDMRVLLVDTDIRSHGLTRLIGMPEGPGLSEVLAGTCTAEKAILSTDLPNLHILPGGMPTIPPAELLASRRFQEFVEWSAENFKLVLFDAPPVLNLADVEIVTAGCDGVLMVVRAQKTRRDVLQKSAGQLDAKKLLGVVYNGAEGAHHHYTYAYQEAEK